MMRTHTRAVGRLLLAVAAPLVLLMATEGTLRLCRFGYATDFVLPDDVNGQRVYRDNPRFGFLYFNEFAVRIATHFQVPRERKPGSYRICLLGGSAVMGDPEPAYGVHRVLDIVLSRRYPDVRFEVLNLGMPAINSHVVRRIARDTRVLKPDLVIVYMGNNEVVGPFGPGSLGGRKTPGLWRARWGPCWRATRLGQCLASLYRWHDRPGLERWRGMEAFLNLEYGPDDPALDRVYTHFARNLTDIVRAARGGGARVGVCTVANNLREPPFAAGRPTFDPSLSEADLVRIRDEDRLRFRADSRINSILRETAPSADFLLDADKLFRSHGDEELFYDHVHFTFAGACLLACALADQVAAFGERFTSPVGTTPDTSVLAHEAGFTPWDELRIWHRMYVRLQRPPFRGQRGHHERMERLEHRLRELARNLRGGGLEACERTYLAALARRPDDELLGLRYGLFLNARGRAAAAEKIFRGILDRMPHHTKAHYGLAQVLAGRGRLDEALDHFRLASEPMRHAEQDACLELGATLAEEGRHAQALPLFERAAELAPADPIAHYNMALALEHLNRVDEAMAHYRRSLSLDADQPDVQNQLGLLLAGRGETDEAVEHFRTALALNPDDERARVNLERALQADGARRLESTGRVNNGIATGP